MFDILTKRYRYRIYPNKEATEHFNKTIGCCRYVYNKALAEHKLTYEDYLTDKENKEKPSISHFYFTTQITKYKYNIETPWLLEAPANSINHVGHDLAIAFKNFFDGLKKRKPIGYPKFKKKNNNGSIYYQRDRFKIIHKNNKSYLWLEKLGTKNILIPIVMERELPSIPSSLRIVKESSGKFYVSFVVEVPQKHTEGTKVIGIDLGLTHYFTVYDGETVTKIDNPKWLKAKAKKLKKYQKRFSRCTKGSKRQNKARLKVAIAHEQIRHARKDWIEKQTTNLINGSSKICVETLKVANMIKNRRLSKAISDVGWGMFVDKLISKSISTDNCTVVAANQYYPSTNTCSSCNTKTITKLRLGQRKWTCHACGNMHDRDGNAAMNLRNIALQGNVLIFRSKNQGLKSNEKQPTTQ